MGKQKELIEISQWVEMTFDFNNFIKHSRSLNSQHKTLPLYPVFI